MSRIESGKIHLEETEVSLSEVLHDLKTIISGQIHAKQLELYMDAMDVTNEDVYCDKTRLNQVLLNLCPMQLSLHLQEEPFLFGSDSVMEHRKAVSCTKSGLRIMESV